MIHTLVQTVITYLHQHPHAAGIIVFFIACGEALAVVGTIIPGSVTMTAVGVLIGSKIIPGTSTLIWAMCGAVLGDYLSYAVGLHYKKRIHKVWPFRRYPHLLEKGEKFFRKHGGKSIIIGRFFGPARSMVPLIAGTFNMRPKNFFLAAVPSACAWAVAYMIPGILLGAISLELPPNLAFKFLVTVLLVIFAVVALSWLIHFCSRHFAKKVDQWIKRLWKYLRQQTKTHWLIRLLTDPRHPRNHRQLILVVYALLAAGLFLILALNVFTHGVLTRLNLPLANLLRSIRTGIGDDIMLSFTILGSKYVMLISAVLIFCWFCLKRYWRIAVHWLMVVVLAGGSVEVFKYLLHHPRPNFLLHGPITSSFPSGHTCLTTCFIGALAMLAAQELRFKARRIPYAIAAFFIILVGFSRLYLTAHWLTDVVGGVLLGMAIVLFVTISYRRGDLKHVALKPLISAVTTIFLVVWIVFGFLSFKNYRYDYTLVWPSYSVSPTTWIRGDNTDIPIYRPSRFGYPLEAFNMQWHSKLATIVEKLKQQGWVSYEPDFTVQGLVNRLSSTSTSHPLPLLPQTYHNSYPVLLMTKELGQKKDAMILRLWRSNITIENSSIPLWLGIVSYRHSYHKWIMLGHKKLFFGATNAFVATLEGFSWRGRRYPAARQPKIMRKLHWDGKLLLLWSK